MSGLIPIRGGAQGKAGLLLAINPQSIAYVSSAWDIQSSQNMLRLHLNNGRIIGVAEEGASEVLEALGLNMFVEDWVLDLEKDIG